MVQEGPVTDASPVTCKVYHGRKNASEYIFRLPDVRESRALWDQLKQVHETYKYLSTARLSIELLEHEALETERKIAANEQNLKDLVSKAAQSLSCLESPQIRPDMIIAGGNSLTAEQREQLSNNSRLYSHDDTGSPTSTAPTLCSTKTA